MNITGYKGNIIKVNHRLKGNSQLAVFYPGYGYTLDAPVFFYLKELFASKGFDILGIDYRYNENEAFLNADDQEKDLWFEHDCSAIGKEVNNFSQAYARIAYVGKSLGTTMLMNQLRESLIPERAEVIYLTPGVNAGEIYKTIQRTHNRTLAIYGNADKYYNKADLELIRSRKDTFIKEINNAGHIFETEGNLAKSILNLVEVIGSVDNFIEANHT